MSDTRPIDDGNLLTRLLGPPGPELSCEQCFEHLDRYAELQQRGADADAAVPGMRAHLLGCSACMGDLDSIRALLDSESAGPGQAPSA